MNEDNKNIQLSDKLEYLMSSGILTIHVNPRNRIVFIYRNEKMLITEIKTGGRLIDFVNDLVELKGLYPLIQKFHREKEINSNGTARVKV